MRNFFLLVFAVFILLSCDCDTEETGPNACTSDDPINEIPWLIVLKNSITNCSCEVSVFKGTYENSKTVYFVMMNDPLCNGDGPTPLFNCYGGIITTLQASELIEHVSIETTLYSCKD